MRPHSLRDVTQHGTVDVPASWIVYLDHDLYTASGTRPDGISTVDRSDGTTFVLAPTPEQLRVDAIDRLRTHLSLANARCLG